jgi:hypothetical protein
LRAKIGRVAGGIGVALLERLAGFLGRGLRLFGEFSAERSVFRVAVWRILSDMVRLPRVVIAGLMLHRDISFVKSVKRRCKIEERPYVAVQPFSASRR